MRMVVTSSVHLWALEDLLPCVQSSHLQNIAEGGYQGSHDFLGKILHKTLNEGGEELRYALEVANHSLQLSRPQKFFWDSRLVPVCEDEVGLIFLSMFSFMNSLVYRD
ncbi:hypothetical protein KIN20_023886 [Parelaphostrongylus tenuis]|uniref:Uncharacterized protein n=1 Tax=Parelaphostrongylus tenuis TaxID=148309 RepID=A0AAD5N7M7_PARTN|nr:hypothetical protein KIN20_023886 [Parelaphostrongylus tenuis]